MTPAEQLIANFTRQGVVLQTDGKTIRLTPKPTVDPTTLEALRTHKTEIIHLLQKPIAAKAAEGKSQQSPQNSDLCFSAGANSGEESSADSIIAATINRINLAFPPGVVITDWHEIDQWHWALNEGRRCGDTEGVRRTAAEFEAAMQRQFPPLG